MIYIYIYIILIFSYCEATAPKIPKKKDSKKSRESLLEKVLLKIWPETSWNLKPKNALKSLEHVSKTSQTFSNLSFPRISSSNVLASFGESWFPETFLKRFCPNICGLQMSTGWPRWRLPALVWPHIRWHKTWPGVLGPIFPINRPMSLDVMVENNLNMVDIIRKWCTCFSCV